MLQITSKGLAQSKRTSEKAIRAEVRSFAANLVMCCNAQHDAIIMDYMSKAGAPTACTRTQLEKSDFYKRAEGMLANYVAEGKRVRVSLTSKAEDALVFNGCIKFHNLEGVKEQVSKIALDEYGISHAYRYYTERVIKVLQHEEIKFTDAAGKVQTREVVKLDAEGKKVYEEQTRKMWVCEDAKRYTLAEVMRVFFAAIGVDKAIADAKADEAAAKAEKAAQAAKLAADVAAKVAQAAEDKATSAAGRAEEKKKAAEEKKKAAEDARKAAEDAKK
jgi:hypothetical protein